MKKQIFKLLPLFTAAILATSCDKNDEPTAPVQTVVETQNFASLPHPTYTHTNTATKGTDNSLTKALKLNDDEIDATWNQGDIVNVYQNGKKIGELTAQSDGKSTTLLTGSL